jgi:hypothetical protein
LLKAPYGAKIGTIVMTVYAAVLREIKTQGAKARFCKTGRGKFALKNVR